MIGGDGFGDVDLAVCAHGLLYLCRPICGFGCRSFLNGFPNLVAASPDRNVLRLLPLVEQREGRLVVLELQKRVARNRLAKGRLHVNFIDAECIPKSDPLPTLAMTRTGTALK